MSIPPIPRPEGRTKPPAPTPAEIRARDYLKDKPGARTEAQRQQAERDALISGLTHEVSRIYDKLEKCEDHLAALILIVKKQGAAIRKLDRTIVGHFPMPPGLGDGHGDD